jgi:protein-L-isoaspartate(D-aspartate) O-methyltransferase
MGRELSDAEFARLRHQMVDDQLRGRGLTDTDVLAAMEKVPRHLFVPPAQRHIAYTDGPLPIGSGQTISQPYMVARMTELLRVTRECRVLEIGTGSGYQAAVLAELAGEVWTVERLPELARRAEDLLLRLGYDKVHVVVGDGTIGFPDAAPYDAIVVTAAAPHVPTALRGQLKLGGQMVIPVTGQYSEDLRLIECLPGTKATGDSQDLPKAAGPETAPYYRETSILGCVFVPLIGEDGYQR